MAEEKENTGIDLDSARFLSVVSMFATSTYQSMGKLANPVTGKTERNLEAARGFIDVLIMLRKKTAGNLSEAESKMLDSAISDLQLNFVREKEKPEPEKKEEKAEEKKEEAKAGAPPEEGVKKEEEKKPAGSPEEEQKGEAAPPGDKKEEKEKPGPIITPPPDKSGEGKQ